MRGKKKKEIKGKTGRRIEWRTNIKTGEDGGKGEKTARKEQKIKEERKEGER